MEKINFKQIRKVASSNANILALLLTVLVFWLINPSFLNNYNMKNLMTNMAPLLVMACGATYVRIFIISIAHVKYRQAISYLLMYIGVIDMVIKQ